MAEPTLRDFQFLIQLVDSGLIQASFKFVELRALLKSFNVLTPDVDAALAQVEANPALIDLGVQTLKDALTKWPLDTPISVAFGSGTGGGGGTVANPITLTPAQIQDAYKAMAGIAATSSKAVSEFLTGPNGEKVVNAFYEEMKALAALQADVIANKITKTVFIDKMIGYSIDTSALALQALNFFTGKTPTQAALNDLIDNPNSSADLTDYAYAIYNTGNKYIAFAIDQATKGAGAAAFKTAYDTLTFRDAVTKAYDAIIGNSKAAAAGINVNAAVDYIVSQQAYFTAAGHDALGAKAAMAGFLMYAGMDANVGTYNEATRAFLTKAYEGTATYGADLTSKGSSIALVGQPAAYDDGMAA